MIKILICCASGSGTSQLMAITAQKACKSAGVEANVKHCPIAEGKSSARNYDLVLTSPALIKMFDSGKAAGVNVYPLKNPLSQDEIIAALKAAGYIS